MERNSKFFKIKKLSVQISNQNWPKFVQSWNLNYRTHCNCDRRLLRCCSKLAAGRSRIAVHFWPVHSDKTVPAGRRASPLYCVRPLRPPPHPRPSNVSSAFCQSLVRSKKRMSAFLVKYQGEPEILVILGYRRSVGLLRIGRRLLPNLAHVHLSAHAYFRQTREGIDRAGQYRMCSGRMKL